MAGSVTGPMASLLANYEQVIESGIPPAPKHGQLTVPWSLATYSALQAVQ